MKKGEVWFADLSGGRGREQKGQRPVLVLGEANGMTIAAPLTTNTNCVKLDCTCLLEPTKENGLSEDSIILVFQLAALDAARFTQKIGWITDAQRREVDEIVKRLLRIGT